MSYLEKERSEELSEPVELYRIRMGGREYLLTSYGKDFVGNDLKTYRSTQIIRTEVSHDAIDIDNKLKITIPVRSWIAKEWLEFDSDFENTIEIVRTHKGDPEDYLMWKGYVAQVTMDKTKLSLVSLPTRYNYEKVGNRAKYSRLCRRMLYGHGCGVNKDLHKIGVQITANMSSSVYVNQSVGSEYVAGMLTIPSLGLSKLIIDVRGNELVLINPIMQELTGTHAVIYKGCDKTTTTCANRFNNLINHGGFPFIPVRNIFTGNLED